MIRPAHLMPKFWLALLQALLMGVFPFSFAEAGREWWKEPGNAATLDQREIDVNANTAVRIKWDEGYIEARAGATANPKLAVNRAHEKSMALKAARHLAYEKLAETVGGITLTGETTIATESTKDVVLRGRVQARIKGARVVSETVTDLPEGAVWAEVVVGLPLKGQDGLPSALVDWATSQTSVKFQSNPAYSTEGRYTGVIVDASGLGFAPALSPRLVAKDTNAQVYGPQSLAPQYLSLQGFVGYSESLQLAKAESRVGSAPLVVRAIGATGQRKGDLLVSKRDAERILVANRQSGVLRQGAFIVVVGKAPGDFLKEEKGKRYALVIGLNEFEPGRSTPPIPSLQFAANDARGLTALLVWNGGYSPEDVRLFVNEQATKEAIYTALRSLAAQVQEEDIVLFYFSGHGTVGTAGDGNLHYYLVPYNASLQDLPRTALRDDALEELIGQLPAKRVVILLDACHSGGVGRARAKGFANRAVRERPGEKIFVEASEGRVILSASRPEEVSIEDDQIQHGVFTHFLLEGMSGKADLDRDGAITVLEAYQYVSSQVRAYTQGVHHFEQRPVLDVRGLSGEITLAATK